MEEGEKILKEINEKKLKYIKENNKIPEYIKMSNIIKEKIINYVKPLIIEYYHEDLYQNNFTVFGMKVCITETVKGIEVF